MPIDTQREGLAASVPPIDFTKIAFPSDKITLADLRRVHPREFDTRGRNFFDGPRMSRAVNSGPQETLAEMLSIERMIARLVFESVSRGKPEASVLNSKWEDDVELIEALARYYEHYGVTQGPQESMLRIRSIEEQAAEQAERLRQ